MSYRCKTCNKELEDYIFVCDKCGTKKPVVKFDENKDSREKKNEDDSENKTVMILTSIIIMFLSAGVIVYGFLTTLLLAHYLHI